MLNFTEITIKSSSLGEESLIPDIHDVSSEPYFNCDESVPDSQRVNIGKGMIKTTIPYKTQNMYDRKIEARKYKAAILENDVLKAVFLPELGGRLWSLYNKKEKRDIVYCNDALIFANLGFTNVWFAGGVEWNVGMRGHAAYGCRNLFARKAIGKGGNDILQMYEYEEKRGVVYCINACLDGEKLYVKPEIHNVSGKDTYMYWWTNIAVPETKDTRTFVPTHHSYVTSYREGGYNISRKEIPYIENKEISFCKNAAEAVDYFYDIPENENKWICSLDEKGFGLLHSSTSRLIGRKNFMWGQNEGGRHWNEWLTLGRDYYEIQAGLIKTQFETFVMKKDEVISWTESYQGLSLGTNDGEYFEVSAKIGEFFENPEEKNALFEIKDVMPLSNLGCGKGYIASLYRGNNISNGFDFPRESVSESDEFYINLFENKPTGEDINVSFTVNPAVLSVLEQKNERSWLEDYILAIGMFEKENFLTAKELFKSSISKKRHYLPLAALALFEDAENHDHAAAHKLIEEAVCQRPDYYPLASVYGEISIRAKEYEKFCRFFENAPENIKNTGRIIMYAAQCYTLTGELDSASKYLNEDLIVPDVREGEYSLSNIWVMLKKRIMAKESGAAVCDISDGDVLEKYPLPYSMDFRMHPKKTKA